MSHLDADIIIVGAGIHGAAIGREACRRGFKVILLEQFDGPAQGTSSRSSKLIHGGLRYLESLELNLVYECLSDRRRLLEHYPDLVKLQRFYIPIYTSTSRSPFMIRLGLSLYALLGGLKNTNRFHKVNKQEWQSLDGLSTDNLVEVFQYHDAQTNDAELTARLIEDGISDGLQVLFNAEFQSCEYTDKFVTVHLNHTNYSSVTARYLINAAGPWVNHIIRNCQPAFKPIAIDLVQGSHIEIPGKLAQGMYYLEAPQDQRAVFVMPWQGHILVGTTETIYTGEPADCAPTVDEINYLLDVFNHYFKQTNSKIRQTDIINSWAGLRVLPKSNDNPFKRTRETIFLPNRKADPNIFSIYGGKLTSHYSTATKLLKLLT